MHIKCDEYHGLEEEKKRAETLFGMNCTKFNVHALSLHVEWESRYTCIPGCH